MLNKGTSGFYFEYFIDTKTRSVNGLNSLQISYKQCEERLNEIWNEISNNKNPTDGTPLKIIIIIFVASSNM